MIDMCTSSSSILIIVFLMDEYDTCYCFIQEEKETVGICTNVIVFLQDEKETVGICTNVSVFLQEEKDTVDMCTNVIHFLQDERL